MEEDLSRINEYELAFYRRLGIRKFRDFTFLLEKIRHRKDSLRNSNYHLQQLSYRGAQRHYMYLSYNALIHLMGLVMAIMLILLRRAAGYRWTLADLGLSAAVLTNIYCIMLQRYNALRIRKYRYTLCKRIKKREEKNAVSLRKKLAEEAEEAGIRRDVEWISRAAQVIEENSTHGSSVFIIENAKDTEKLRRLADWTQSAGISIRVVKKSDAGTSETDSELREHRSPRLYAKAERNVRRLRRFFAKGTLNDRPPCCVIVIGNENLQQFRRLFPVGNEDEIIETVETLRLAAAQS